MLSFKIFFKNRKYFAPAFLYSCFSLIFSTWVTYIPFISDKLHIGEGKIGGALFFTSVGALVIIPVCNRLIDKIGVGKFAFFAFLAYSLSMYGMFLASTYAMLCVALFFFGMMGSFFAISLNSLTAIIEKQAGMYIMSGSHGFWSMGGIIGASSGSFITASLKMPLLHITLLIIILIGLQLWLKKEYFNVRGEYYEKEKHRKLPVKPLLAIASVGLVIMVSEGAIADWSALYLKKVVLMNVQFLGLGYALFSLGMTLGRFTGDALSNRLGSWKLLRIAIGTALIGFILVLLIYPAIITLIGFFVIGLGFSVIIPEVYRLASTLKGIQPSEGVSVIAVSANIGFLTGPVVLGFIAELHTLHLSFLVLGCFVTMALLVTVIKK